MIILSISPPASHARAVSEKYYYARHPEVTRVVDISATVEKKVEANLCNGPKVRAVDRPAAARDLAWGATCACPCLVTTSVTAERAYIKEFMLTRDRELGRKYGVEYAEQFHYIGQRASRIDDYIKKNAVPLR